MMENDDTLIKNFMLANKHEIEDNGFSRGVIRRLPQPAQWLSDILSVTCAIVCCALSIFSMALKFYARQSVT